ncbi:MAG: hypothetical protein AB7H48_00080 [Parachlamydiales bacterium]
MSNPIGQRQSQDLNRTDFTSMTLPAAQQGIAAAPTSINSFRESTQAEPSSSLCSCLSSFANWIKEIFLSLFGVRSNAPAEFSREWLAEKANAYIDAQCDRNDLTYPLKAVAIIELNGRILAMPRSDVARDLSDFNLVVKQALTGVLDRENLQDINRLGITTYLFSPVPPNPVRVTHSISGTWNSLNIPAQQPLVFQELAGSHNSSSDFLLTYLRDNFYRSSREELFVLANFLCSEHQHLLPLAELMFGPRPTD